MKIKWKELIFQLIVSLGVGGLSALFIKNSVGIYDTLNLPPFSPPALVFPIVWSILYALMGISAYLIYCSGSSFQSSAFRLYGLQLVINFFWPIFFFQCRWYWFSFFWLILLLICVILMIRVFLRISPSAGYLQVPYCIWLIFAGYLNLGVAILN